MAEGWVPRFKGPVGGRHVELLQYDPTGELKVVTTQRETESTGGSFEPGSNVFPTVISAGDPIAIEASTADELVQELMACGFTAPDAKGSR